MHSVEKRQLPPVSHTSNKRTKINAKHQEQVGWQQLSTELKIEILSYLTGSKDRDAMRLANYDSFRLVNRAHPEVTRNRAEKLSDLIGRVPEPWPKARLSYLQDARLLRMLSLSSDQPSAQIARRKAFFDFAAAVGDDLKYLAIAKADDIFYGHEGLVSSCIAEKKRLQYFSAEALRPEIFDRSLLNLPELSDLFLSNSDPTLFNTFRSQHNDVIPAVVHPSSRLQKIPELFKNALLLQKLKLQGYAWADDALVRGVQAWSKLPRLQHLTLSLTNLEHGPKKAGSEADLGDIELQLKSLTLANSGSQISLLTPFIKRAKKLQNIEINLPYELPLYQQVISAFEHFTSIKFLNLKQEVATAQQIQLLTEGMSSLAELSFFRFEAKDWSLVPRGNDFILIHLAPLFIALAHHTKVEVLDIETTADTILECASYEIEQGVAVPIFPYLRSLKLLRGEPDGKYISYRLFSHADKLTSIEHSGYHFFADDYQDYTMPQVNHLKFSPKTNDQISIDYRLFTWLRVFPLLKQLDVVYFEDWDFGEPEARIKASAKRLRNESLVNLTVRGLSESLRLFSNYLPGFEGLQSIKFEFSEERHGWPYDKSTTPHVAVSEISTRLQNHSHLNHISFHCLDTAEIVRPIENAALFYFSESDRWQQQTVKTKDFNKKRHAAINLVRSSKLSLAQ